MKPFKVFEINISTKYFRLQWLKTRVGKPMRILALKIGPYYYKKNPARDDPNWSKTIHKKEYEEWHKARLN